MINNINEAKIFLTDYDSYNNGKQFEHGHWINLGDFADADSLNEYVENHFKEVGISDPEIMVTDYEGLPKNMYSESGMDFEEIYEYFETLEGASNPEAMAAYIAEGYNASDFDEAFQGEYDNDEDFAREFADQIGAVNENATWPNNCIDWEYAAKELMYDYFSIDNYYFRSL